MEGKYVKEEKKEEEDFFDSLLKHKKLKKMKIKSI